MKFTSLATGRRRRALVLTATISAAALAALTACSSSSSGTAAGGTSAAPGASGAAGSGSQPTGSPLTVADVAPFSGPDASLGPTYLASCYGATSAINAAGGVNGHPLTCKSVDTRGDPADAVPAVNQMFASTSNLALVIGCTSDEAAAVAPIINSHKMTMFCMTGQSEFDSVKFPYFYRLVPPDLEESYAMVAIAQQLHYQKIALAFGNDIGSQTFIQPAISALKKAGMTLTTNQALDLTATTFRTEAEAIVQSHPDAIMTEALGSADPTLFSEIAQLNGGKMIPIIGTSAAISPAFFKGAAAAVGASVLRRAPVPAGQGPRCHRQLHHLPERARRSAPVRRNQPGRARDDHGQVHRPQRLRGGHGHDRQRRARRDDLLFLRGLRPHGQRGQGDQVRGTRRPDQLRQLPRLDRHLPD
jgi:branched-chain amino acid transport system substrate-binding protein